MKSIDFSSVTDDLNRHTKRYPELLLKVFKSDWSFLSYFSTKTEVIDRWLITNLKLGKMVQPGGTNQFTPKENVVKPEPRYGEVKKAKIDLLFDEEDLNELWESYLAELENRAMTDPTQFPFFSFIINACIEQAKEEVHLESVFKGVLNAAGAEAVDCFDGVIKKVKDYVTAGKVPAGNVYNGATISSSSALDQIEAQKAIIPDRFRSMDMICVLSPTLYDYYCQDYRATFGALPYNTDYPKPKIDGTNISFVKEDALEGSQYVYMTMRKNFEIGMYGMGDIEKLEFQKFNRDLKMLVDWRMGVDVRQPEYVWVNNFVGIA